MPTKETLERVAKDKKEGKAPSTQAGEFIKETIDDIRSGKHGARSTKQAIAIGLSKARRAGVDLPPPKKGATSETTRKSAQSAYRAGQQNPSRPVNPKRSRATKKALQKEGDQAASHEALSNQAHQQASKRTAKDRSEIGRKAAETRLSHSTAAERSATASKAAKTRREHENSSR